MDGLSDNRAVCLRFFRTTTPTMMRTQISVIDTNTIVKTGPLAWAAWPNASSIGWAEETLRRLSECTLSGSREEDDGSGFITVMKAKA